MASFRISLITWDAFDLVLETETEEQALALAKAIHGQLGEKAFRHTDGGIDGWVVDRN
jgi:hypothetical protein